MRARWVATVVGLVVSLSSVAAYTEPNDTSDASSDEATSTTSDPAQSDASQSDATNDEGDSNEALEVQTTVDTGESVQVPRMPSGFTTRLTPGDALSDGEDLGDVLESAAGVTIQRQAGPGHPAYLSLRGGNPRQATVLFNGTRISAPAGLGFDVGSFSTGWIDSLEIRRGASAIVDGSGALTGSLHISAHAPEESGGRAVARGLGGSFGTVGLSGTVSDGNDTSDGGSDDAFVSAEISGGIRASRGNFEFVDDQGVTRTRLNNDIQSLNLMAATRGQFDDSTVNTALLVESDRRGAPGPSEFQRSQRRARIDNRRAIATAQWSSTGVAAGDWGVADVHAHAGYIDRTLDYANPDPLLGSEPVRNDTEWRSVAAGTGADVLWSAGIISHLTLESRFSTYSAEYSAADADNINTDRKTIGIGLSNEILLADDDLSLVAAVRSEIIRGDRTATPVMPAAGLIWRALPWLTAKANVAYSHRMPDFDELYLRTGAVRGNPELDPERSVGWDIGLIAKSDDFPLNGGLTFFQNDVFRSIRFLPTSAYEIRAVNLGGAQSHGIEAFFDAAIGNRWRAHGSYTWTRAALDALSDVQLARQPRHRARLETSVSLGDYTPFDRINSLQLDASGHYRSRVNLDNFGNITNPPYWRVDVGASISPEPWVRIGLNIRNVNDYRRGADSLQRPLPGRAIYGSLRLQQHWH